MVSSDEVREELVELRGASGLSALRVRDLAPKTMTLPAVDAYMAAKAMAGPDRHVATDAVIRCVVNRHLYRSDWSTIAERTFNIGGPWGTSLTDRRRNLVAEMNLSQKQYGRLEEETYVQCASALLTVDGSPCEVPAASKMLTDQMAVELVISETSRIEGVLRILPNLTRSQACRLMLADMPNAQTSMATRANDIDVWPENSGFACLEDSLIALAMIYVLPGRYGERRDHPFLAERQVDDVIAFGNFGAIFHWTRNWYNARRYVFDSTFTEKQFWQRLRNDDLVDSEYFDIKGATVAYFAESLRLIEENDAWDAVIDYNSRRDQHTASGQNASVPSQEDGNSPAETLLEVVSQSGPPSGPS